MNLEISPFETPHEGVGDSDPVKLTQEYGWTIQRMVRRYARSRW